MNRTELAASGDGFANGGGCEAAHRFGAGSRECHVPKINAFAGELETDVDFAFASFLDRGDASFRLLTRPRIFDHEDIAELHRVFQFE